MEGQAYSIGREAVAIHVATQHHSFSDLRLELPEPFPTLRADFSTLRLGRRARLRDRPSPIPRKSAQLHPEPPAGRFQAHLCCLYSHPLATAPPGQTGPSEPTIRCSNPALGAQ